MGTDKIKIFTSSILAGMCIGLGGFIYLTLGGIPGAIGFTLGLICVVYHGLFLFTGKSGQIDLTITVMGKRCAYWDDLAKLYKLVLVGNIVGGLIISYLLLRLGGYSDLSSTATELIRSRLDLSWGEVLAKSIGCGLIMDLIVYAWTKHKSVVPILFGVPGFILSGFLHSIAEPFYIFSVDSFEIFWKAAITYYPFVVIGNFIGCRFRKMLCCA